MPCNSCTPYIQQLLRANSHLRAEVAQLKVLNETIQAKCDNMSNQHDLWEQITSDYIDSSTLSLYHFAQYLTDIILQFPIIGMIINLFISDSHKRKERAHDTNPKWLLWSSFYQSWIADVFLRSRSPKSVRRTTLLVSAFLLLGNVSQPCWRLLQ